MTVSIYTLGCKLNLAESDALTAAFSAAGFEVKDKGGGLCIINTCTVTGKACQKARRVIRLCGKTARALIVTGCAVQTSRAEGNIIYAAAADKPRLLRLPAHIAHFAEKTEPQNLTQIIEEFLKNPRGASSLFDYDFNNAANIPRSRPFIKVQDGCDKACAYCAVRLARGKSLSLDRASVLKRLSLLEEAGFAEAVLSGVNITSYPDLAGLITFLLASTRKIALRLSSMEPDAVDEALLDALTHPRVRSHFHLSVQSGSDAVLERMGRRYTADDALRLCRSLRLKKDDPFLAADIITGFPGETEADFEKTFSLCTQADFAWIHAFPFSPRPGTAAASMKPRVPERVSRERAARLKALALRGKAAYSARWEGRRVEAVVEQYAPDDNFVNVVTANYLKKTIPRALIGKKKAGESVIL